MSKSLSTKQGQITGLGQRLLELKELLAFSNLSEFAHFLMINPSTFQRLITRNPNNNFSISTEMIFRMLQRIPQLNANWLLTGKGAPLVDFDAIHGLHTYKYYKNKITDLQASLENIQEELKRITKKDNLPSSFSEYWNEELERQVKLQPVREYRNKIRLGSNEKMLIREMLENKAWIRHKDNTYNVMSGALKLRYLPEREFLTLLEKDIFVKSKMMNHDKYLINSKHREQLKSICNI